MEFDLTVLKDKYAIYKFDADCQLPKWVYDSEFLSITKTTDELSVVTLQNEFLRENFEINTGWRIIKILGPLDFSLIGIIADISKILKEEQISIFVISTYNTDYILVKEKDLGKAKTVLLKKGYNFKDC